MQQNKNKITFSLFSSFNGFFFIALVLVGFKLDAQVTSSPYSRYGVGDLNRGTFSQNFSLGNTSIGLRNPGFINIGNPASYSSFDLTVFEVGLNSNVSMFTSDTSSFTSYHASFAYLGFGLPITPWWGMSFGVLPFSSIGYNIIHEREIENIGLITERYQGSGGVNKVFWGNGLSYRKFSAGFNASYLFGTLTKERRIIFDPVIPFNTVAINETSVSDFVFDTGIQFRDSLSEKWVINLGAVYGFRSLTNATRQEFVATYESLPVGDQIKDTVVFENVRGNIVLPQSFGAGFSLESSRLLIAGDWKYAQWADFRNFGRSDSLVNNSEFTFGAQFTPDKDAVVSFWKRVQYRAGARYNTGYLQINNQQISEYGITFGAGLPLRRARTTVNVGFEIGQRGTTREGLIREQYINFNFGMAINDKWFIQRKYD
ncbi:MAG: hypothetical protein M3Q58_15325 [Bacteroidota bacterium]|nr:hypothetical protein [Bacteroidota bacterium]